MDEYSYDHRSGMGQRTSVVGVANYYDLFYYEDKIHAGVTFHDVITNKCNVLRLRASIHRFLRHLTFFKKE